MLKSEKIQENRKLSIKKARGITLIALVVTIIVLLILAGISISMLAGNNSILIRAGEAKTNTENESDLEVVKLAVTTGVTENLANQAEINTAIQDELRKSDSTSTVTGEDSEKTITYKEKMYIVNIKTGKIEQTTAEKIAKRAIKIKVNTGEDGVVQLPVADTENCTIDWGDGTTSSNTGLGKDKNKIASKDKLKLAGMYEPRNLHTYSEKNKEYIVSITGEVHRLGGYNNYSQEKIIEIVQWGETGLEYVTLSYCSNLEKIATPSENSFKLITDFTDTFFECTSLTSIPEGLFDNCPNVTNFSGTFFSCTSLTSIPEGLFDNCPNVTNFGRTFADCTSLTSIPEGLFDNCPNVTNFEYAFSGCTSLTGIPEGLFDNCINVTGFVQTFSGCTALRGIAPELWTRGTNNQENNYHGDPNGEGCFNNCNQLDNYSQIPAYWKTTMSE